jgi:hypothetical protein
VRQDGVGAAPNMVICVPISVAEVADRFLVAGERIPGLFLSLSVTGSTLDCASGLLVRCLERDCGLADRATAVWSPEK